MLSLEHQPTTRAPAPFHPPPPEIRLFFNGLRRAIRQPLLASDPSSERGCADVCACSFFRRVVCRRVVVGLGGDGLGAGTRGCSRGERVGQPAGGGGRRDRDLYAQTHRRADRRCDDYPDSAVDGRGQRVGRVGVHRRQLERSTNRHRHRAPRRRQQRRQRLHHPLGGRLCEIQRAGVKRVGEGGGR